MQYITTGITERNTGRVVRKNLNIPGAHYAGVYQIRNEQDYNLVEAHLTPWQMRNAVIFGSSYLALDIAYRLKERGIPVTLVIPESYVGQSFLPEDMAMLLETRLRADGFKLIFNDEASVFIMDDDPVLDGVQLKSGHAIITGLALYVLDDFPNSIN